MDKLVIWGASGHARVVADIVRQQGLFTVAGFLDSIHPERRGEPFFGSTVLGGAEQLDTLTAQGIHHILPGFGDCTARLELIQRLQSRGFTLPVAVHPAAVLAPDVQPGPGTVIAAGAVINPACHIGTGVIINTVASVDHDCVLGDASHIGPGAHLAGQVQVGPAAQLGVGVIVAPHINIGAGSLIGAGAVVVRNIPGNVVAYGNPAKIKRILTSL